MDVFEVTKRAICKIQPGLEESKIVPGALLKEDLDIDSLDMVELALALEDATNLSLPEEDLDGIITVDDIVSLIESKER